jgi:rubrerythrin
MSTDALAAALAAEEHRQGRPYLADPEHCDGCADVDWRWEQATCTHGRRVDIRSLEDAREHWYCDDCGHTWRGDPVPTVPPAPPLKDMPELVEWGPK